jgi:arylsulfatase B
MPRAAVGSVLERIPGRAIENDTLIFFISDNGEPTQELTLSNAPLRGGKRQLYEGGVRVPMLVQWKGSLAAGQLSNTPVIATDIGATALSAAGADVPKHRPLAGRSYDRFHGDGRTLPSSCSIWPRIRTKPLIWRKAGRMSWHASATSWTR